MSKSKLLQSLIATREDRREYQVERLLLAVHAELRRKMDEDNISQADLARSLDVSEAHVSRLLNEYRNITVKSMAQLADALGYRWESPKLVKKLAKKQDPHRANGGTKPLARSRAKIE